MDMIPLFFSFLAENQHGRRSLDSLIQFEYLHTCTSISFVIAHAFDIHLVTRARDS